jgi:O-antigen/teichoic acid export membrane protein
MLIRNSLLYVLARLLPGVFGMATTALLTRLLDVASYGIYGLALVIMTFVSTMGFDWLGVSFLRFYDGKAGSERTVATFVHIFLGLLVLSGLLTLLAWAVGAFTGAQAPIYALGILLAWSYSWFELAGRLETAGLRPFRYLAMNLGRAALIFLGAVGAAWLTRDPVWTAVGTGIGMFGGALLGTIRSHSVAPRLFDPALARRVLAFGVPLAASLTLTGLISAGTRALVGVLGSAESLGLYTAAFILTQNTLIIIGGGIASAGYPLAVRAVESGDVARARRQLLANGSFLLAVMAPACLGMALTADGVANTLVGHKFAPMVAVLTPWMAAGAFFGTMRAHFLDHAFQLGRRPGLQVWVTCVAAAVALGLSVLLIPRYGPVGAAIGVTMGMAVSAIHASIVSRFAYPVPLPIATGIRVLAACLFMGLLVRAVPGSSLFAFAAQVAVGAVAYAAAAFALNILDMRSQAVPFILRRTRGVRSA